MEVVRPFTGPGSLLRGIVRAQDPSGLHQVRLHPPHGRRDNVKVLREVDGQQKVFMVDLRSGSDLYNSPVFYLQQKDIIYVDPNVVKMRQSTVNGNNVRSTSFWISIASVLTSVAVLITNILK